MEATLRGRITELEEKCAARDSEREQMEVYIYILLAELEKKIGRTK